jgi:hypothetical protein
MTAFSLSTFRVLWLLMLLSGIDAMLLRGQTESAGTLNVLVTDSLGIPVAQAKVRLIGAIGEQRKLSDGQGRAEFRWTYGHYGLNIELSGFKRFIGAVDINQPRNCFRAGLRLASIGDPEPSPPVIRGSVFNYGKATKLWAKVVQVYTNVISEGPVDDNGKFELRGDFRGPCVLMLFSGSKLAVAKQIDINSDDYAVSIDLSSQ